MAFKFEKNALNYRADLNKGYNEIQTHTCGSPDKGMSLTGWVQLKRLRRSDIWAKPWRMSRMLIGRGRWEWEEEDWHPKPKEAITWAAQVQAQGNNRAEEMGWCKLHRARDQGGVLSLREEGQSHKRHLVIPWGPEKRSIRHTDGAKADSLEGHAKESPSCSLKGNDKNREQERDFRG